MQWMPQSKSCSNRGSNSGPRACEARVITNYTTPSELRMCLRSLLVSALTLRQESYTDLTRTLKVDCLSLTGTKKKICF